MSLRTRVLYLILSGNLVKSLARCNQVKVDLSLTTVTSGRKQPVAGACTFMKRSEEFCNAAPLILAKSHKVQVCKHLHFTLSLWT